MCQYQFHHAFSRWKHTIPIMGTIARSYNMDKMRDIKVHYNMYNLIFTHTHFPQSSFRNIPGFLPSFFSRTYSQGEYMKTQHSITHTLLARPKGTPEGRAVSVTRELDLSLLCRIWLFGRHLVSLAKIAEVRPPFFLATETPDIALEYTSREIWSE